MKKIEEIEQWKTEIMPYELIPEDLLEDYFVGVLSGDYTRLIEILKMCFKTGDYSLTKIYQKDSQLETALNLLILSYSELLGLSYEHFIITRKLCDKKKVTIYSEYLEGFAVTRDFPNFIFTVADIEDIPSMRRSSLEFMRDFLGDKNVNKKKKEIRNLVDVIINRNYKKRGISEKINSTLFAAWCLSLLKIIKTGILNASSYPKHIEYINSFSNIFELEELINVELEVVKVIWQKFIYFEQLPSFAGHKDPSNMFWEFLVSLKEFYDVELVDLLRLK